MLSPRHLLFTLPALLASSVLCAAQGSTATVLRIPTPGVDCPVSLSVERRSQIEIVNIGDQSQHPASQRIRLTIDPVDKPSVSRAELTVHASSLRPQILPAGTQGSADVDRTFQISGSRDSGLHQRDLWIDGVGSVISVDLTSITYADGTTWHRSPGSTCRAFPSGFTLVSSQ